MDLPLFARVIRRHPRIVVAGVTLAVALSILTLLRISSSGVSYRQHQQWVSYTTLEVTQEGFPWGSLSGLSPTHVPYADDGRLATLAVLYSQLVSSDSVERLMRRQGSIDGTVEAVAVSSSKNSFSSSPLPFVRISALSPTAADASRLSTRAADALMGYVRSQQEEAGIKPQKRVLLQTSTSATSPTLYKKRSRALPLVVLITLLIATALAAFMVENVKQRTHRELEEARDTVITQPA